MNELAGKTVIVTGANCGIGRAAARDMAQRGARVILACRSAERGQAAAEELREDTGNVNIVVGHLDLGSLNSVREFTRHVKETESRLDILINNAGIWTEGKSADGFDIQFAVNHLGHFLLTLELLDLLKNSAPSRVVNLSSAAHKGGQIHFDDINLEKNYAVFKAYSQSKLANILFTRELHRRVVGSDVTTYAVDPGFVKTNISRYLLSPCCMNCLLGCFSPCLKSASQGAETSVYCAVAKGIEEDSGKYFRNRRVERPAPHAEDDEAARRLWDLSTSMVASTENVAFIQDGS